MVPFPQLYPNPQMTNIFSKTESTRLGINKHVAVMTLTCCLLLGGTVQAQEIQNEALADLITKKDLAGSEQNVKAALTQNEALITCDRHATDDDNMCKLRAILMAKCVFDSQPNEIQRTKIQFLNLKNNSVSIATIKRSEIILFGEGKLDKKALMSSIDYIIEGPGRAKDAAQVADGDLQNQRTMLLRRIQKMKERGTNVTPFMNIFREIEGMAKSNSDKAKLGDKILYLSDKVSEQERALEQVAQRPSKAGGSYSYAALNASTGSSYSMPADIKADLDAIDPGVAEQCRNIRTALVRIQGDPRARQALDTLDRAIRTRNVMEIGFAAQNVINVLQSAGAPAKPAR
jgi:hypothetical protein